MRKRLYPILLLLDGFALGGLAAVFLTSNLILDRCCSAGHTNQAIYNLLDYIFPYKIFFAMILCVLVISTLVVGSIGKPRRTVADRVEK